ncbi:MAG TPA: DinB family protein [Dehalococcoidia bacterium]|nr:DinB family protein [Dehalococcoidia bacterium]
MAASKSELLDKLRTSRNEIVSKLRAIPPDAFEQGRYESGWNGRQILAHIASMEWSYPRLIDVAREAQSPRPAEASKEASTEPASRPARGGINDYNERQVEKRAHMSVDELIGEFETNRAATIAAFEQADESLLDTPIRSAGGVTGPLADVVSMIAIAHVDQHARDIAGV